jgi:hypothetical protein
MDSLTVLKRNVDGLVTWQYSGTLLERGNNFARIEALFNRPDMPFMGIILKEGDRFVELFYTDRWYNIFEIHDRDEDRIKGWYCNLGRPAVWDSAQSISYVDLALDLWVSRNGEQTVLDQDEFEALGLDEETRLQVFAGLQELQTYFRSNGQFFAPD